MSDYDLPELPSDEELGITDEDRRQLEEGASDGPDGGTEPSDTGGSAADREKPARRPWSRFSGPVWLVVLIGICLFASVHRGMPSPVPASAPDSVFSSDRAMAMVSELARAPHPLGSPEHARVLRYLVGRLESLGLKPEVQTTSSALSGNLGVNVATVRNVVARIPGTASTGAVLVTAHYDSEVLTPGAGDDASGVAAILEAVRAFTSADEPRNDVIILFSDGEEFGLLGARAFADEHPWMADVSIVVNFEMRGDAGPSMMFETRDRNGWIIRALREFDPSPIANSMSYAVYHRLPNDTDFTIYRYAERQGLNFAAVDGANTYHHVLDTPENLSASTLQDHGGTALGALRHFAAADLSSTEARNVVFFTVPVLGLVVYDSLWVIPLTVVLLLLTAGTVALARRKGARTGRVLVGSGVSVLGAALAYGAGMVLLDVTAGFHPEAGSLLGSLYHREGWYVLSLTAAVSTIVLTLHRIARRWVGSVELALGATLVPLLGATVVTFVAPLAAMNLQWPTAAALLSVVVLSLFGSRESAWVGRLTTLALAVPVLFILVPLVELLWLGLSLAAASILGVGIALTLQLVLPALEGLGQPNRWWAPLTGLVVTGAALGMGILSSGTTPSRPAPSTLLYTYEHGTGAAYWATDPSADPELDAAATAWAVDHAGSPFSARRDLSRFAPMAGEAPVTEAPLVDPAEPLVEVLSDTTVGPVRRVSLSVRSAIGAEGVGFAPDSAGRTRLTAVNGIALLPDDQLRWVAHWGEPDTAIVAEMEMPAGDPIGVDLVEHLLRPGELLGREAFARPEDLAPDLRTLTDRAVIRFSLGAYVDPEHAFMPVQGGEPVDSLGVGGAAGEESQEDDPGGNAPTAPDSSALP